MAVVRITKELRDIILSKARNTFDTRMKAAQESRPGHHWSSYIYEKVFGKYIPIMEQLPASFFATTEKITINRIGDRAINLNFELPAPHRWPVSIPADAPAKHNNFGASLNLNDDLVWGELYAEIAAWQGRCAAVRQQTTEFCEGVDKVLSSFSTLAPAIKAWPPLWDLLPDWAKDKHKEISEKRKTKTASEIEADLGKLTGVMTAAKLGGL